MNHSMYGADRGTHLKIVVVSLACATLIAAVGVFARVTGADLVVRFQHSHPVSARPRANVGIKGPLASFSASGALDLTFASRPSGLRVANVKSAPLGAAPILKAGAPTVMSGRLPTIR